MKICDLTMAYNPSSGGIKTYIDQKRRYLLERTTHEHLLIAPGDSAHRQHDARTETRYLASPPAPGYGSYRVFWRPDRIKDILMQTQPDVVELGTFFLSPWPAFDYRRLERRAGRHRLVTGFFHTDIASAYVEAPIRQAIQSGLHRWSETLEQLGVKAAELLGAGAEEFFLQIFTRCDLMLASTPGQVQRLAAYGASDAQLVPLGVDLEAFHPQRRCESTRRELGVGSKELMLIYAGRLDQEKRPDVLVDAWRRLPDRLGAHLVLVGDGPRRPALGEQADRQPRLHVLGYQSDKQKLATLLASADVYVTAGPHETFGLSVIEAQASGLPVVGVDAGALIERVVDGVGYLAPVDDSTAMAERIDRAAAERSRLGEAARRHVESHFSWTATFDKLVNLYERALRDSN